MRRLGAITGMVYHAEMMPASDQGFRGHSSAKQKKTKDVETNMKK